jgi:uncharacterized protein (DUF302 family)
MMQYHRVVWTAVVIGLTCVYGLPVTVMAKDPSPRVVIETKKPFQTFTQDLTAAVRMKIPGNQVFMIYRPDFAVRMLKASVEAGFEAPIRIYVVEQGDGTTRVSYIKPSDVFADYENAELNAMAHELDTIFAAILRDATQ